MKELETRIEFTLEDGSSFEAILLKEFIYLDKKYAILIEENEESIGIFEVENNETFKPILDNKFYDKLIGIAEEVLYEE